MRYNRALASVSGLRSALCATPPTSNFWTSVASCCMVQEGAHGGLRQQAAVLARSAREAWARRPRNRGGSIAESFIATTIVIEFLAAVTEDPGTTDINASSLAASRLVHWLLAVAADAPAASAEREGMVRYLLAALRRPDAAAALLGRPGSAPRLLSASTSSLQLQAALAEALQRCDSRGGPLRVPADVPVEDARAVVGAAALLQQAEPQRLVALRVLRLWAQASAANCAALAEGGAGGALAEIAAASSAAADPEVQVKVYLATSGLEARCCSHHADMVAVCRALPVSCVPCTRHPLREASSRCTQHLQPTDRPQADRLCFCQCRAHRARSSGSWRCWPGTAPPA